MFEEVAFDELYFVNDWDVVEEPIEEKADLPQDSEYFENVIFVVKEYFYKLLILDYTFEEPKQFPGVLDRLCNRVSRTK